ncbi:MAG: hypothetical protein K5876_00165 [Ruminiclostridium sp.]|nr:hypothetical protein [Ruminiclostridium sp.]
MKKAARRMISVFLAAVMLIGCLTVPAGANVVIDELAPAMIAGALKFEENIDISDIVNKNKWSLNEVTALLANAYLVCPELFFVSNKITVNNRGSNYYIQLDYTMSKTEQAEAKKKIDAACEKIVAGITPDMTDVEKLLYVHDYLILNCKYDYDKKNYDMYDCLLSRSAVCQGYSLAYMYILKHYLGIECSVVISDAMGHAWNYVKLGNSWYHVDVTKDDAATVYKNKSYDNYGFAMHENFLMSDELCRNTSQPHYKWKVIGDLPAADDTSYDGAFWRNVNSPIILNGKTGYYAVMNEKETAVDICSYNFKKDTGKPILRVKARWYSRRNDSGSENYSYGKYYYKQIWTSLALRNNKIYFNTNKNVYSYDLSTKKSSKLYTLDKDDRQIFGMMFTSSDMLRLAYRYDVTYPESYLSLRLK